jgi:hypothetical protein
VIEYEKLLEVVDQEIGYLEKSWTAYNEDPTIIYDKTAGAGRDNVTKYAKEMDELNVYNTPKQGYAWCKVFIDWCMVQAFGEERAMQLLYGWTAGVTDTYNWFTNNGQIFREPEIGDLVIFRNCEHIGIVVDYDDDAVYTVEGNTSSGSGLVSNGGTVALKQYSRGSSYIKCYARPEYEELKSPITIQVHVQNKGWLPEVGIGEVAGTTGEALPLEAIILNSDTIDLEYRAHCTNKGWTEWVRNGEIAGTTGEARPIEAIEIKSSAYLKVSEHLQNVGWMPPSKGTSIFIGTTGKALPMEAFIIEL